MKCRTCGSETPFVLLTHDGDRCFSCILQPIDYTELTKESKEKDLNEEETENNTQS